MIKKVKSRYAVLSETAGRSFGTYKTLEKQKEDCCRFNFLSTRKGTNRILIKSENAALETLRGRAAMVSRPRSGRARPMRDEKNLGGIFRRFSKPHSSEYAAIA